MIEQNEIVGQNPNDLKEVGLTLSERIGLLVSTGVGTLQCALLFALIALLALPDAINSGLGNAVSWFVQDFIQFILLSVILAGQNAQAKQAEIKTEVDHHTLDYLRRINDQQIAILQALHHD